MDANRRADRGQRLVPEIPDNQSFKVLGLGGTGGIFNQYAALFVASTLMRQNRRARWVLVDGDSYEHSNAARQIFKRLTNKAAASLEGMLEFPIFAEGPLTLVAVERYVNEETIADIIREGDVVSANFDNHPSRRLVADYCSQLRDVAVFFSGNDGVEPDPGTGRMQRGTHGSVYVQIRKGGRDVTKSPCHWHPELRGASYQRLPGGPSCVDLLAGAPQILLSNFYAAALEFAAFYLYFCGALHYAEAHFDWAECMVRPSAIPVAPAEGASV
ncbi:MAG: ThiF family adenylyltransferase [Phycisphaerae bacterium]|nr:ThiF family adenylyltransferase [Phycisphaerae bacterium]